jgi:hypothetical protein
LDRVSRRAYREAVALDQIAEHKIGSSNMERVGLRTQFIRSVWIAD